MLSNDAAVAWPCWPVPATTKKYDRLSIGLWLKLRKFDMKKLNYMDLSLLRLSESLTTDSYMLVQFMVLSVAIFSFCHGYHKYFAR
jgi:hypothetical protein